MWVLWAMRRACDASAEGGGGTVQPSPLPHHPAVTHRPSTLLTHQSTLQISTIESV